MWKKIPFDRGRVPPSACSYRPFSGAAEPVKKKRHGEHETSCVEEKALFLSHALRSPARALCSVPEIPLPGRKRLRSYRAGALRHKRSSTAFRQGFLSARGEAFFRGDISSGDGVYSGIAVFRRQVFQRKEVPGAWRCRRWSIPAGTMLFPAVVTSFSFMAETFPAAFRGIRCLKWPPRYGCGRWYDARIPRSE